MEDFKKYVSLAKNGDTDAFAKLYSLVYKDMYHIALYSLRNSQDASDAVSETVLDAFSSIGNLRNEEAFKHWIMKILSAKIKKKQREYMGSALEYDELCREFEEFDYEMIELKEALESLDDESRNILSMSVLGGYTSQEISKMFKMNAATVRSKLMRIKQHLKISLSKEGLV
ncbi:MAG: sigma-70 family RNA polymerase sigma factor [Ruminococcus sp.]|nr:sigma-70 family RNA polymerase sigma factor [Ruminococcus sp.]